MNLFDPTPRSAFEFLPARHDLDSLREAAKQCRGCDLYRGATQVVFGEGRAILHMPEPAVKDAVMAGLVQDLKVAAEYATARRFR